MKEGSRPSFAGVDTEKKLQIVSGINNNKGGHQVYTRSWSRPSTDSPPHFPTDTEPNDQLDATAAPKPWRFRDQDSMRRNRIAKYKSYGIAGRVMASIRNGAGWIKNKCSQISHGY
ncbi:uncharacterized protein LOC142528556 [Primulina tabacum]|uniref:uncharacterized protein LOC142528556 n=1 Tax=Primulina tabacum TaxID=48773 RepID=UPI003F5A8676